MSLQLSSTIDSFAGAELHAAALRHAGLPDSFGSIGAENAARLACIPAAKRNRHKLNLCMETRFAR
jgi:hypothetical protein